MVAAQPLPIPPTSPADAYADGSRFTLYNVSWEQYVTIREALDDRPGLRITYLEGTLELMSPSSTHERFKTNIARLLELWAVIRGVRIHGLGSTTYKNERMERALEPDECYFIGQEGDVPDIALEVALSSGGLPKLEVYRGLGVREVWFWRKGRLELFELVAGPNDASPTYAPIPASRLLPTLDLEALTRHALMEDQAAAAAAWFDTLKAP